MSQTIYRSDEADRGDLWNAMSVVVQNCLANGWPVALVAVESPPVEPASFRMLSVGDSDLLRDALIGAATAMTNRLTAAAGDRPIEEPAPSAGL